MTQETLYRVEKFYTTGWEVVENNLSKLDAKKVLDSLLDEGYSPDRLKVVRVN